MNAVNARRLEDAYMGLAWSLPTDVHRQLLEGGRQLTEQWVSENIPATNDQLQEWPEMMSTVTDFVWAAVQQRQEEERTSATVHAMKS